MKKLFKFIIVILVVLQTIPFKVHASSIEFSGVTDTTITSSNYNLLDGVSATFETNNLTVSIDNVTSTQAGHSLNGSILTFDETLNQVFTVIYSAEYNGVTNTATRTLTYNKQVIPQFSGIEEKTYTLKQTVNLLDGVKIIDSNDSAKPELPASITVKSVKKDNVLSPDFDGDHTLNLVSNNIKHVEYFVEYEAVYNGQTLTATRKINLDDMLASQNVFIIYDQFNDAAHTYNLKTDTKGKFVVKYVAPTQVENIILVVTPLKYGAKFSSKPDNKTNSSIIESQFLDASNTTIILKLKKLEQSEVIEIDFKMEDVKLSNEQAIEIMDNGFTGSPLNAKVYQYSGANIKSYKDGVFIEEVNYGNFTPIIGNGSTIKNIDSYNVGVSSLGVVADRILTSPGEYWSNNGYYYTFSNAPKESALYYQFNSVSDKYPLTEITNIRLYVPHDNLELKSLKKVMPLYNLSLSLSTRNDTEFDLTWEKWNISGKKTDAAGKIYYDITPNQRYFNVGLLEKPEELFAGFVAGFRLIDTSQDFPSETDKYVELQALDTVVSYKVRKGDNTTAEENYAHKGPKLTILARKSNEISYVYEVSRYDKLANQTLLNVIAGSYYTDKFFNAINYGYEVNKESNIATEHIADYKDGYLQKYTFPFNIQPSALTLNLGRYISRFNKAVGSNIELEKIEYKLLDGTSKTIDQSTVDLINKHYTLGNAASPKVKMEGFSESNPVSEVNIYWKRIDSTIFSYPFTNQTNVDASGKLINQSLDYGYSYIVANFDYYVSKYTDKSLSSLVARYSKVQVKFNGNPNTVSDPIKNEYNSDFLWFRLTLPQDPMVSSRKDNSTWTKLWPGYDRKIAYGDGKTEYEGGSINFEVGNRGARSDVVENPRIDLNIKFSLTKTPTSQTGKVFVDTFNTNHFHGITEEEGLAFFTGSFIGTKALSNWKFTYDTNQRTNVEYVVPTLTGDTQIQIPKNDGEFFKKISLSYDGSFNTGHPSDNPNSFLATDSEERLPLMKEIKFIGLTINPFTNEKIHLGSDYQHGWIDLVGSAHWDNCGCEDGLHQTVNGQPVDGIVDYNHGNNLMPAHIAIYYNQYYEIQKNPTPTIDDLSFPIQESNGTFKSVYQGQGAQPKFGFSVTYNLKHPTLKPYTPGDILKGLPYKADEKAYIELLDDEIGIDLDKTKFYGVPLSDPNVISSIEKIGDKKFLKIEFKEGYIRKDPWRNKNFGRFEEDRYFTSVNNDIEIGGPIQIGLIALPGSAAGIHYPIGDIYLDYSDLLDNYNGHLDTATGEIVGAVDGMTKYGFINAVTDDLGLSDTLNQGEKLFKWNFNKGSTTEYKINVLRAAKVGADLIPGKLKDEYQYFTKEVTYKQHEIKDLNQRVLLEGSNTTSIYDISAFVRLPRKGTKIVYFGEDNKLTFTTGEKDLFLKAAPTVKTSTNLKDDAVITFQYTKDVEPDEKSNYFTQVPTSEQEWRSITGYKVTISEMPKESTVLFESDLVTDEKNSLDVIKAYGGGKYTYYSDKAKTAFSEGYLGLNTWLYENYDLVKGNVFWDTYDENGLRGQTSLAGSLEETGISGLKVKLYDASGKLIDETLTDADGNYTLRSFKLDAGQYVIIDKPTENAKLTSKSDKGFEESNIDSDFDRKTYRVDLPQATPKGFTNVSAGFVKLPSIQANDVEIILGRESTIDYKAILTEYLGKEITDDMTGYKLEYVQAANTEVASVDAGSVTNNANTKVITGVKYGNTTAKVRVTNLVGDVVEVSFNIVVKDRRYKVEHWVRKSGAGNADGVFFHNVDDDTVINDLNIGDNPTNGIDPKTYTGYVYSKTNYLTSSAAENDTVKVIKEDGSLVVRIYYEKERVNVSATKVWANMDKYHDRSLPQGVINIYRSVNNVEETLPIISKTVSDSTSNNFTVSLFKYDDDGNEYSYRLQEEELPYFVLNRENNTFTNTYTPTPKTFKFPSIKKELTGIEDLHPEEFKFLVTPLEGAPALDTLEYSITGDGDIELGSATYLFGGSKNAPIVYRYQIEETNTPNGYIKNNQVFTISVSVVDSDGKVSARITSIKDGNKEVSSIKFVNEYKPDPVKTDLEITKEITGRPTVKDETFTFKITDGKKDYNVQIVGANKGKQELEFNQAGTYKFDVVEIDSKHPAYIYDNTKYQVEFVVSDTAGTLKVEESKTKFYKVIKGLLLDSKEEVEKIVFSNEYKPNPVEVDPPVEKKIINQKPSSNSTFTFVMKAKDAKYPMPKGSENGLKKISIVGEGSVEFGFIKFEDVGVYEYEIYEEKADIKGYTFDERRYLVTITVTDDGSGSLKATRLIKDLSGNSASVALFENHYKMPVVITPVNHYDVPLTGFNDGLAAYVISVISSLSLLAFLFRKKEKA